MGLFDSAQGVSQSRTEQTDRLNVFDSGSGFGMRMVRSAEDMLQPCCLVATATGDSSAVLAGRTG